MTLSRSLYKAYWAIEQRLVPGLRHSQAEYEEVLGARVKPGSRWLDLGCGSALLPPWRGPQEAEMIGRAGLLVGADVDRGGLRRHRSFRNRVCADGSRLPFPDASFDLITANMVVEHLPDPVTQFREVARLLRSGGHFLFHTPNLRSYATFMARVAPEFVKAVAVRLLEERREEDRFRTYYRANSPQHITALAREAGLSVVEVDPICTGAIFALFLPLAIPELLWIRVLREPRMRAFRPNLIVTLSKP